MKRAYEVEYSFVAVVNWATMNAASFVRGNEASHAEPDSGEQRH
jgi:hypothetical protein